MRVRVVVLGLLASLCAVEAHGAGADDASRIGAYMAARTSLSQFSGTVLVAKNGKVVFTGGYGMASYELRVPNRSSTRYLVGSITKQFTAAAILQLRDAAKLDLEDSICSWIEKCPEAWQPATLAQLLNHSSGVPDYESALGIGSDKYFALLSRTDNIDVILEAASGQPLDFPPGSKYGYSNTGYILLSKVVTKASGQAYPDYVREHLLKPAGMSDSGILTGGVVRDLASGYEAGDASAEALARGIPMAEAPLRPAYAGVLAGEHGDGNLYTTAADLNRWVEALHSGKVLKASSVAEMETKRLGDYGYGVSLASRLEHRAIGHGGVVVGYVSRMDWYPDDKVTIILLSNFFASRWVRIARDLEAIVFGLPYDVPKPHAVITADPKTFEPYDGDYLLEEEPATVQYNGRFLTLDAGRFQAGLLPLGHDDFFVPFLEGTAHFERDSQGRVTALRLHYEGQDHVAPRQ
jgi:CubicO group peptidase (beta-lactamase class C family)